MTSDNEDRLQAVLWDMDGTLVDTEPYWLAAQTELAQEHGITWTTHDARATVGQADLLGVDPAHCVAVEDSVSGTTSAQAAGIEVVVVPGIVQPPPGPGRHFVGSLRELTVDDFRDILGDPSADPGRPVNLFESH